jgi:hypothetical protein
MDEFSATDVWRGVMNGFGRFSVEVDRVAPGEIRRFASPADATGEHREVFEMALKVLANRPRRKKDWNERGVRLFAEILTIGVLSRRRFNEKPLDEDQIFRFVGEAELFFNSWNHTHFLPLSHKAFPCPPPLNRPPHNPPRCNPLQCKTRLVSDWRNANVSFV